MSNFKKFVPTREQVFLSRKGHILREYLITEEEALGYKVR